jgi:lysophospholipase L1-like esterase
VGIADYEANLREEIEILKTRCDLVIFVTTTRVPDGLDQTIKDRHADYRAVSLDVANDLNVPVCDLFLVSETISNLHIPSTDNTNVHFVPEGYRQLGVAVSECVRSML